MKSLKIDISVLGFHLRITFWEAYIYTWQEL